jgi:DNA-binding NarL/FixJ family response regulator
METGEQIRILSVEDHPVFREGLSAIISSQPDMLLVGHAGSARDAVEAFRLYHPDVTLMDHRLPAGNGVEALIEIRREFPAARIVMLTNSEGDAEIQSALRSGAAAYLLKSAPATEMLSAIRTVHAGQRHISGEVATILAEHLGEEGLTPREMDVLRLISDGHRNKEIAAQLDISETTVNFHIKNLVSKLRANDRAHAVALAVRRGILEI